MFISLFTTANKLIKLVLCVTDFVHTLQIF